MGAGAHRLQLDEDQVTILEIPYLTSGQSQALAGPAIDGVDPCGMPCPAHHAQKPMSALPQPLDKPCLTLAGFRDRETNQ